MPLMGLLKLTLLSSVLVFTIGCGSPSPTSGAQAEMPEPTDIFEQLGIPASDLPVRWLEAGAEGSGPSDQFQR